MRPRTPGERIEPRLGLEELLWMRREGRRPRRRSHLLVLELAPAVLLAAFVCAVTPLALANDGPAPRGLDAGAYVLCALAGLSFAVRRRFALLTYLLTVACTAAFAVIYHGGPVFVTAVLSMPWLVSSRPRRQWVPLVLGGAVVLGVAQVLGEGGFGIVVIVAVWLGAAVLFGEVVRSKRAELAQVRARAQLGERRREEETLRRLAEERLRIAREVHDVVGHGLAAISLQAGVAEHLLDSRPDEARKSLAAIRQVSKTALDELRSEIGALRGDGEGAPRRPTPGLDALPSLVASMRAAGLGVDLGVRRHSADHPPDVVQTAGYRIVQEALTNVVRHAGSGARADVRLECDGAHVEVEVRDDGAGARDAVCEGNGMTGMRERAAALGGRFEAGSAPEGGFRVWALLPAGRE